MSKNERKRELLTFLFAKKEDQPTLFRAIINKKLIEMKKFMDSRSKDEELQKYNKQFDYMIYQQKLKEIEIQTKVLKEQIEAYANGIKHPSLMSIIERKLFIVEIQLDVGVYNLINNNSVKFYIDI
jgi:hypothetical protein